MPKSATSENMQLIWITGATPSSASNRRTSRQTVSTIQSFSSIIRFRSPKYRNICRTDTGPSWALFQRT